VATLLLEVPPVLAATLVLDFLSTFYDQDVKLPDATRLLQGCLGQLQRLAAHAPVLVSARPPIAACAERQPLLDLLRAAAAQCWEMDEAQPAASVPGLFGPMEPGQRALARDARDFDIFERPPAPRRLKNDAPPLEGFEGQEGA
jgi:hypothetical protein